MKVWVYFRKIIIMGNFSENFEEVYSWQLKVFWKIFEKILRIQFLNYLIYEMRAKFTKNFGTFKINFI